MAAPGATRVKSFVLRQDVRACGRARQEDVKGKDDTTLIGALHFDLLRRMNETRWRGGGGGAA